MDDLKTCGGYSLFALLNNGTWQYVGSSLGNSTCELDKFICYNGGATVLIFEKDEIGISFAITEYYNGPNTTAKYKYAVMARDFPPLSKETIAKMETWGKKLANSLSFKLHCCAIVGTDN